MARSPLALFLLLPALAAFVYPTPAHADPRTAFLVERLKTSDDYRVRTQAALALGASGDDAAVQPLCGALADGNATVKVAAAAALGKLSKAAGLSCLQSAEKTEAEPSVKTQLQKSIASLQAASTPGGPPPPPPGADTKVYVAIQVTNKTKRPEVEGLVRASMQSKLLTKAGYAVAPRAETPAQGGQIVKSKKLKGFYLIATVEAPVYNGGKLSQTVRVSMWSYPDKALQGEFSPKITQDDTPSPDPKSEEVLVKLCIENAVETFHKIVASL